MIEGVPAYVSITFIITTFLTIGFFFHAIKKSTLETLAAKLVVAAIAFWIFFTAILALGGFYLDTSGFPPRFISAPIPALIFIAILFIFFRGSFVEKLPLKTLTLLHVIRIPVEIVLWWLFLNKQIPRIMTFEGWNFDILAGLTAPLIFWIAFRGGKPNRALLLIWNIVCLLLVSTIVVIAILSLPTAIQQFGLDQPNVAVLNFPYIWLPAIVVPVVLFSHLASLWNLVKKS